MELATQMQAHQFMGLHVARALTGLIFRIAGVTGPSIANVIAVLEDGASQLLSARGAFAD